MTEVTTTTAPPPPRARTYLALLLLIPGLAMLGVGLYRYLHVEVGGRVDAIKVSTKPGFVGQASEAMENIKPETPDLYVKVFKTDAADEEPLEMPPFKNTPIGNGITWRLEESRPLKDVHRVEVWDYNRMWKNTVQDRITFDSGAWDAEGQRFHVTLEGAPLRAPRWALPVAIAGGVVSLMALLKFVWDQVI